MITREKLEEILNEKEDLDNFLINEMTFDYRIKVLNLLREKIPYEVCKSIIGTSEHDQIYLCNIDDVLPYINEEDANVLEKCHLIIDDNCDCLVMFT